jgi:hypothetical protein
MSYQLSIKDVLNSYRYYSNVSRGKRQKEGIDDVIPCILEPQGNEKAFRKNWARLIMNIQLRFHKRAATDPSSLPNRIASPCFLMQNR